MEKQNLTAISLFASGGIGDLSVSNTGWDVLLANELLEDRAELLKFNHPNTEVLVGDIRKLEAQIITRTLALLNGKQLDLLFATPPCQGMSKNGRGKLLKGIRDGQKPKLDERNQLIINAVNCIKKLKPRLVVFENVPEMQYTMINNEEGNLVNLLDYVVNELSPEYIGNWEVVEFADYGVPQRRQRLITVFTREEKLKNYFTQNKTFLPPRTHSKAGDLFTKKWVSVVDALNGTPSIDAKSLAVAKSDIQYHYVPVLDKSKYFWVSNTPYGKGAFDNQCVNPNCMFDENPTHGSSHNEDGINQSNKNTPIRCIKCNDLLPRPWVEKDGEFRLMSGFTSAYKRMRGDLPASALTSNMSYACSDQKIHPTENRVLSLYEGFILHTISDFNYSWERRDGKKVSDKTIREVIGESIPPKGLAIIFNHLNSVLNNKSNQSEHIK